MNKERPVLYCRDGSGGIAEEGDPHVPIAWWSFTKTVLSICALQLVDEGQLDLDGELPNHPFTLRHLLQNNAGVNNYSLLREYHEAVGRGERPWSEKDMLQRANARELLFAPGDGWSYSNIGFMFVSQLIERTMDLDIGDVVRSKISNPLGLTSVQFARNPEDLGEIGWGNATGYNPGWVYHGLLTGSACDATELLHQLMAGRLISAAGLKAMTNEHRLGQEIEGRPWSTHGYGLGLMMGTVTGLGPAMGHSGAGPLNVAAVYHFPEMATPITCAAFAPGDNEAAAEIFAIETLQEQFS